MGLWILEMHVFGIVCSMSWIDPIQLTFLCAVSMTQFWQPDKYKLGLALTFQTQHNRQTSGQHQPTPSFPDTIDSNLHQNFSI